MEVVGKGQGDRREKEGVRDDDEGQKGEGVEGRGRIGASRE